MGSLGLLLVTIGACCFIGVYGVSDELKLYEHITSKNNPHVRPVNNSTDTVRVSFGIALIRILDVDEETSSITNQVWVRMLWEDQHITWNPSNFGDIKTINIPVEKIWKPDMVVYNTAEKGATQYQDAMAVISWDGTVLWIPPMILKSTCTFDMSRFPFDSQECSIKFGSWTFDGFKLDIDFYDGFERVDLADYIVSNEWRLTDAPAKKNMKYYPCCQEPYPDMVFTLKLSRFSGLQSLIYIAPIVVIAVLCPFLFLLPYSQSQRFTLGGCLLICLVLLLSSLERIFLSAQSSTPYIAGYYVSIVVILVVSLIVSAIIANLADRANGSYPLPNIIKKIFIDGIGRIVCVSSANVAGNAEEGDTEKKKPASNASEWRSLATVLDRLFFIIYVVLTIILSLAFLI